MVHFTRSGLELTGRRAVQEATANHRASRRTARLDGDGETSCLVTKDGVEWGCTVRRIRAAKMGSLGQDCEYWLGNDDGQNGCRVYGDDVGSA